jgi:hypothetical protein
MEYTHIGKGARWFVLYVLVVLAIALGAIFWSPAHAQEPRTATIIFTAPTHYVDGTPIAADTPLSYHVYQGERGGQKQRVATITETAATIDTGLPPGEMCWEVTAVANGVESARSNEGCKFFPWPAPQTITITVQ